MSIGVFSIYGTIFSVYSPHTFISFKCVLCAMTSFEKKTTLNCCNLRVRLKIVGAFFSNEKILQAYSPTTIKNTFSVFSENAKSCKIIKLRCRQDMTVALSLTLILTLKVQSARLDLHESGIIGKPFKRTSTAICF